MTISIQDFINNPTSSKFADVPQELAQLDPIKSLSDKTVEKTMLGVAKAHYTKSVEPGMDCCKRCGNMYTASLYGGLASLLSNVGSDELVSGEHGSIRQDCWLIVATLFRVHSKELE